MARQVVAPLLFLALLPGVSFAAQPFQPPTAGCWKVHCNAYENDVGQVVPPLASVGLISEDPTGGSGMVVGCVSNGTLFACNIRGGPGYKGPYLRVYNADGTPLWDSGTLLERRTNTPMIGADGGVIDADQDKIIRFPPPPATCCTAPKPIWVTHFSVKGHGSNGTILTQNGMLTLLTFNGPVMTFDSTSGKQKGTLWLDPSAKPPNSGTWYSSSNSACAQGNRIYDVTAQVGVKGSHPNQQLGTLYSLDIHKDAPAIKIRARYKFQGPSQSSPMCSPAPDNGIFTDSGNGTATPGLFGVTDTGSSFLLRYALSTATLTGDAQAPPSIGANFSWDSGYGCLWARFKKTPGMYCLDPDTGATVTSIDVSTLPGMAGTFPQSDATMTTDGGSDIVMLLGVGGASNQAIAIDTTAKELLWAYPIASGALGQFPIATDGVGLPRVGFTNSANGTYFLGLP
jgi:hypothetical protein